MITSATCQSFTGTRQRGRWGRSGPAEPGCTSLVSCGLNLVAETDLRGRILSELEVEGGLKLVDLTGPGAARVGATGAISTDPHELVRPWSRAIFEHPSSPEGIYYRLKHDLGRKGIAVFDRSRIVGASSFRGWGTLMDPDNASLLGEILEEYDFGLIPR